jgi:hypothetical protein
MTMISNQRPKTISVQLIFIHFPFFAQSIQYKNGIYLRVFRIATDYQSISKVSFVPALSPSSGQCFPQLICRR